jgi:peptidoglycan hydrolase CwlO-like protein
LEDLKTRLTQQHEKELSKLQSKLAKYESGREELVKEKNESNKEVAGLKSEIRELLLLSFPTVLWYI